MTKCYGLVLTYPWTNAPSILLCIEDIIQFVRLVYCLVSKELLISLYWVSASVYSSTCYNIIIIYFDYSSIKLSLSIFLV